MVQTYLTRLLDVACAAGGGLGDLLLIPSSSESVTLTMTLSMSDP